MTATLTHIRRRHDVQAPLTSGPWATLLALHGDQAASIIKRVTEMRAV